MCTHVQAHKHIFKCVQTHKHIYKFAYTHTCDPQTYIIYTQVQSAIPQTCKPTNIYYTHTHTHTTYTHTCSIYKPTHVQTHKHTLYMHMHVQTHKHANPQTYIIYTHACANSQTYLHICANSQTCKLTNIHYIDTHTHMCKPRNMFIQCMFVRFHMQTHKHAYKYV